MKALPDKKTPLSLLFSGLLLSIVLGYVAVDNYRSTLPVAEENLSSLARSLAQTIESLAAKDLSLSLLRGLKSQDIAFFAVIDAEGTQIFHTNPDLTGLRVDEPELATAIGGDGFRERRITLGTGEQVFEFVAPLHVPEQPLGLRLVLHAYRADAIIARARTTMTIIFALLVAGWVMGLLLYRYRVRAVRHQLEMAEKESLARLGTMGAVLAHEVRNPLSGIKGYAQLLEEQLGDAVCRKHAAYIVTEAIRLENLVNELLILVRSEPLELQPLAIDEALVNAVGLIRPDADETGINIITNVDADLVARTNRDRFEQVVLNLLHNAVQAMPAGGALTIAGGREGSRIKVSIRDTGQGIEPDDLTRIFEPFFTTKARGSGLGLAISQKFIEEMQGTITVSSSLGEGSVFHISLPAAERHN